jgi:pimeloyl-ACP methyl ester carboxylesterase
VSLYELDFAPLLQKIQVPIIAINSDLSERTDEARIRKVAPTFRAVTMPGVGHFPMMEDPKRFNDILLNQLSTVTPQ